MAGIEQLEIHSKSYIVRWVKVEEGHTISWSVQPHKKSINFGIVKHPGTTGSTATTLKLPSIIPEESLSTLNPETSSDTTRARRPSGARNDSSTAEVQLKSKGFLPILWHGKCDADKVSVGTHAIMKGHGGMYGLVFDNTFSKQLSKTATFVLLTYPSNAPPNSTHHLQNLQAPAAAMASVSSVGSKGQSPRIGATASESVDSFQSHLAGGLRSRGTSVQGYEGEGGSPNTYHVGVMMKRRRKRGQGYARRYFSLDFVSCTLSYYYSRNSSALRGAIPLSLAAIAADERRREISIDSGAEIWHLKAANVKDFEEWTKALEKASNTARGVELDDTNPLPSGLRVRTSGLHHSISHTNPAEDAEWEQVESLVSRIVGTRDAVRRLVTDSKSSSRQSQPLSAFGLSSSSPNPSEENGDYFSSGEKKPFWKRKASSSAPKLFERSISSQMAVPTIGTTTTVVANGAGSSPARKSRQIPQEEHGIHEHCSALLNDLDSVLADFSNLIISSKRRRTHLQIPRSATPRRSIDSTSTGEFYDAEAGDMNESQLLVMHRHSDEDTPESEREDEFVSDDATSISSIAGGSVISPASGLAAAFFPPKPKSFSPLPFSKGVKRRTTVPAATVLPPSLIGFLRKNVGKDFSTISMPVSANEPTSLLQRVAENLEYVSLLDLAAQHKSSSQRLLYVTAFALASYSVGRARERAIRKPFNPMLGETFELVRGEAEAPGNFRFIAEKVSHRPVQMACQADSPNWTFTHAPLPTQKFWGKSAELITEGRVHVVLRLQDGTDECYSWNVATIFLRNVVMGEKYVEPVGNMSVVNESNGDVATVEFKSKGMFGGRSEDVVVEVSKSNGGKTGAGLVGTWTSSLRVVESGKPRAEIWRAGKLVGGSESRYGFTEFAATLNETVGVDDKAAITDTRRRRDQRAVEVGDLDEAEKWKAILEEEQRRRRRDMEAQNLEWSPRWFVKADGDDGGAQLWKLKGGKEGYWEERAKGTWTGVEDVLCVNAVE